MARILTSGGAGYVGSHCAKALAASGHEVIVLDNLLFGHRDFVRWGKLIQADIRDSAALDAVFASEHIDAVMHFAALAYVGEFVTDPGRYYDVNVNGTRILLDSMVRAGVRPIVFSSSCAIYGAPDHIPIVESMRPDPINPYGFTKLVCERMLDDFARAHRIRSARLRYFNAAGADPTAEIGEDHTPETHRFRWSFMLHWIHKHSSGFLVQTTKLLTARPYETLFMSPIWLRPTPWRSNICSAAVTR